MSDAPFIPPATAQKLAENHPPGTRHKAKLDIAIPLIGNGMPPTAVYVVLKDKFPDASEKEIESVVHYAQGINPTPSTSATFRPHPRLRSQPQEVVKRTPLEHAQWWLSGETKTVEEFKSKSQLPIPLQRSDSLSMFFEMIYDGSDNINILCTHTEENGKAKPIGPGRVLSRDKWVEYFFVDGVPSSNAGAWVRPNPCNPQGTGAGGSVKDCDICAWKFLLIESDVIPIEVQLALFSKIKLPLSAVILSGGISAHAWVRVDARNAEDFSEFARRILSTLQPFGVDQANKNPSRLSRLPEGRRVIGAVGEGIQSLLWLNPAAKPITLSELSMFENSMEMPAIDEKPFRKIVLDSLTRYEELVANKGRLGVPTGFSEFDRDTGGLHPGQMSVVAGETNSGKSSVAINIINNALKSGHGVALFTLEMSREEIADLIFSMNCRVDRNHFNTGEFTVEEMQNVTTQLKSMAALPFWIFDESLMTASQIRKRILALKAEGKIKLAVVDYAQIVSTELGDNREQQVANISRTLCSTAKDAKIALIVLSQLNDEGKIRESRVIAHEAHNVFLLKNEEEKRQIIFKVVKGRRIRKKDYALDYDMIHCLLSDPCKIERRDVSNYYDQE